MIDGAGSAESQGAQPNLRVLTTSRGRDGQILVYEGEQARSQGRSVFDA
jgi:hypothetical protein